MTSMQQLPVAIIGAGPVGLAAAAHLAERKLPFVILEAGSEIAASVRSWGHVRLFSPWRYNVDAAARRLLEGTGWQAPPAAELPTGDELLRGYLEPLAGLPMIAASLRLGRRVTAISRRGLDKVRTRERDTVPFLVRTAGPGGVEELAARAVIDASGTWGTPNPLGAAGLPAVGERQLHEDITYGIPDVLGRDRVRYAGKKTLVVGAGHSAANSLLALAELARAAPGTSLVWATRGSNLTRVFGGGDADQLAARGQLGRELRKLVDDQLLTMVEDLRIEHVARDGRQLVVTGTRHGEPISLDGIDAIIAATGQRPDLELARELRVTTDPALECVSALAPLIDPNEHSCGTVRPHGAVELAQPEPNFYVVGSKSYGRAPTFLLATGYEQARSVVAMLAGDREAALRVELELHETGVCSSDLAPPPAASCGPSACDAGPRKTSCC